MMMLARTSRFTVYGRDNTKQVRVPYFHCDPFKKRESKKERKEKKKRLREVKNFIRSDSKGKDLKKKGGAFDRISIFRGGC